MRPTLIFSVDAVVYVSPPSIFGASDSDARSRYNAKVHAHLPKLKALLRGLEERAALAPQVVVIRHPTQSTGTDAWERGWTSFDAFVQSGQEKALGRTPDGEIEWARLPFDWPLWILFSSGTTGTERCDYFGTQGLAD